MVLSEKNLKNKDFASLTHSFKLLVWVPKIIKTYISDAMGKHMPSTWFKMSNCKIPHLSFCRFFRQSVTKIMGKTAIWTILYSGTMSKTCVKQCYRFLTLYRGRGAILNTLFKIPIIFCHWLTGPNGYPPLNNNFQQIQITFQRLAVTFHQQVLCFN